MNPQIQFYQIKVLYVHGSRGGPGGRKVRLLQNLYRVACPTMTCFLIPYDVYKQAKAIIVASSYGTIIARLLLWADLWDGGVVALSSAVSDLMPPKHWVYVHGSRDTVCDNPKGISITSHDEFVIGMCTILDDDHALRHLSSEQIQECVRIASNRERTIHRSGKIKLMSVSCLASMWLGWRVFVSLF